MEKGLLHLFCEVNSLEFEKLLVILIQGRLRSKLLYLAQQSPPHFTII
jgi:hypothetical protein